MTKAMFAGVANSAKSSLKSRILCWHASSNVRFPRNALWPLVLRKQCFELVTGGEGRSMVLSWLAKVICVVPSFRCAAGYLGMSNTLPTPHERQETSLSFHHFRFCLAYSMHLRRFRTMLPKCRPDQSESNHKPSTNETKIVKRKSSHARSLKVCIYFIIIQILSFIRIID